MRTTYARSVPVILGNLVEWLDFGIYGYSQAELSKALFHDSVTMGWIAFGLGYLARPIGAHVLGTLADRNSRSLSFSIAILGMAGATAGMALIPAGCEEKGVDEDHTTRSWWTDSYCFSSVYTSAIPAILLRCVQGFSAGASAGGVNVMQSESSSASSLSQSVGVNNVSGASASILSAGLVLGLRVWLGADAYTRWGWRLAFGVVIPPSILAACLLSRGSHEIHSGSNLFLSPNEYEPNEYELAPQTVREKQAKIVEQSREFVEEPTSLQGDLPGLDVSQRFTFQHQYIADDVLSYSRMVPRAIDAALVPMWSLVAISVFIQFAISSYNNLNIYLVQYATTELGFEPDVATLLAVVGKIFQLLFTPFAAALADIYGWFTVCGISGLACAIVAVPIMSSHHTTPSQVWWLVSGVLPLVSTPWIVNAPLLVTCIFPKACRSQRTSLIMALGTSIAGFFPLVLHQIEATRTQNSGDCWSGVILAVIAAMAAAAIFWIREQARRGRIVIHQRSDLV